MNFETLHKRRKFPLVIAIIGVISVFLPWAGALGHNVNGFHTYGIVVFLAFSIIISLTLTGDQTRPLIFSIWAGALSASILALLSVALALNNFSEVVGFGISFRIGIWLALFTAVASIACLCFLRTPFDSDPAKVENVGKMKNNTAFSPGLLDTADEPDNLEKLNQEGKINHRNRNS